MQNWIWGLILTACLSACYETTRNPEACCETIEECERLGTPEPVLCKVGQCVNFQCTEDTTCDSSDDCSSTAPACLLDTKTCVPCIAPDQVTACVGSTPICDATNTCRGCSTHDQCTSKVCLADGACADEAQIAYLTSNGDGAICTLAAPCATLAAGLAANRPIIKIVSGRIKDSGPTPIVKRVTIVGSANAKLDRDGDGPIIEIRGANTDVQIFDLEITGQTGLPSDATIAITDAGGTPRLVLNRVHITGNQGIGVYSIGGVVEIVNSTISQNSDGISFSGGAVTVLDSTISANADSGIIAANGTLIVHRSTLALNVIFGISVSGGSFTLDRSTITKNGRIAVNVISAEFDITNNFITDNGSPAVPFGGVLFNQTNIGTRRLEFNTISGNAGTASVSGVLLGNCRIFEVIPANAISSIYPA